ncbi:EAL domain-containing protein [Neisseria sp. Ec49-e6-T10]|uniref:EAL domain-containing protein n=1 Tax=Neisseria sp. Ec49-e6-T10 TaxID=3140744 RepID=UPI003EB9DCF2
MAEKYEQELAFKSNKLLNGKTHFIIFFIVFLTGISGIFYTAYVDLKEISLNSAEKTITEFEHALSLANDVSKLLTPLLNDDCSSSAPALRQVVIQLPTFRSISFVKDDYVYCSSYLNSTDKRKLAQKFIGNRNISLFDRTILSNRAVLVFEYQNKTADELFKDKRILITIDKQTMLKFFYTSDSKEKTVMYLYEKGIDSQGRYYTDHHSVPLYYASRINSTVNNGLTVVSGFNRNDIFTYIFYRFKAHLFLVVIASLFCAFIAKSTVHKSFSPETMLKHAIKHREFVPYVQPLVSSDSHQIIGVEVLIRWIHPTAGMILPNNFIPLAEKFNLIVPITQVLMEQVGNYLKPYKNAIPPGFHIAFNISPSHCLNFELVNDCQKFIDVMQPAPLQLTIEITERELIEKTDMTLAVFHELKKMNVAVALDDFGMGNSNLSYLNEFSVNFLKIDRYFVSKIETDSFSTVLLESIISIAAKFNLDCIAEGVETIEQAEKLKEYGIKVQQGYYFGRPVPLNIFVRSLAFKKLLFKNNGFFNK